MKLLKARLLFESLEEIEDPRIERRKQHLLIDILVIAICAMICHADGWEDIEEFGLAKQEWFETFLELPNGIPSHDTFRRVFILLDSDELKASFVSWVSAVVSSSKGRLSILTASSCAEVEVRQRARRR